MELPAILRAFHHASSNESLELIAFDQEFSKRFASEELASASRRVGRLHLKRLRPLRDHRVVQRYLTSMESGKSSGFHTLVFGLSLAVFSLPLRQGLNHYAEQTLLGFLDSAARRLQLSAADKSALQETVFSSLHESVERLLAGEKQLIFAVA